MMFLQVDELLLTSHVRTPALLFIHLLFIHTCTGQSHLIGPSQPIIARLGDDVMLPCHLDPAMDVATLAVEWTRPDLEPRFVFVWRTGQELVEKKNKRFEGRTSLFDEELQVGNVSLELSRLRTSDEGNYRCFIPSLNLQTYVHLVVASHVVCSPAVRVMETDKDQSGVVLQCESAGWYPKPDLSWLDSKGQILSPGSIKTLKDPEGLYTISSQLTVMDGNKFTCRVHQKDTNQTREALIHVPDRFYMSPHSSFVIILSVVLCICVCLILILIVLLVKQRKKKNKSRKNDSNNKEKETEQKLLSDEKSPQASGENNETSNKTNQQKNELASKNIELQTISNETRKDETNVEAENNQTLPAASPSCNSTDDSRQLSSSSSFSQDIKENITLEISPSCTNVSLRNMSNEDLSLGGWTLNLKINDRETVTHKFGPTFIIKPGKAVTIYCLGYGSRHESSHIILTNLKIWNFGDQLHISMISPTGKFLYCKGQYEKYLKFL